VLHISLNILNLLRNYALFHYSKHHLFLSSYEQAQPQKALDLVLLSKCSHFERCGHSDNADQNAAEVIKKRAINLILDSGSELSKRGVLLGIGRGAINKTGQARASPARGCEASKKKEKAT
jgi:transposase